MSHSHKSPETTAPPSPKCRQFAVKALCLLVLGVQGHGALVLFSCKGSNNTLPSHCLSEPTRAHLAQAELLLSSTQEAGVQTLQLST